MFALADGAVMSAKKDALVNMGGFLALRDAAAGRGLHQPAHHHRRLHHLRRPGGRDMEAIAIGLEEVFDPHYLDYRIRSTTWLGEKLHRAGCSAHASRSAATPCTSMPKSPLPAHTAP
jgi:tryptophanase